MHRIAMLVTISLAVGIVVLLGVTHAGTIYLKEGNYGQQDTVGVLSDMTTASYNFKKVSGFVNDEARSMRMEWVLAGTKIVLFDSPSGSKNDDWAEIVVMKTVPLIIIDTFNTSQEIYREGTLVALVTYHEVNGLDGKVSRAEVTRSMMASMADPVLAMYLKWDARYSGFPQKGGEALEYSTSGSNYRLYRPDVSLEGLGFRISFKMDHIRGWAEDDHAIITATLDREGNLQTVSNSGVLNGDDKWFNVFVDVFSEIPEQYKTNKYVVIAETAARVASKVYAALLGLAESGGREIFVQQIQHKINEVLSDATQVLDVTPVASPELPRRGQIPVEGSLLKAPLNPAVYVIYGGAKFYIPSEAEFEALGFAWEAIQEVSAGVLASIPNVPYDGTLLKERSNPAVYVMQNGHKSHISSEQRFVELGFAWEAIRVVPDGGLAAIPDGPLA